MDNSWPDTSFLYHLNDILIVYMQIFNSYNHVMTQYHAWNCFMYVCMSVYHGGRCNHGATQPVLLGCVDPTKLIDYEFLCFTC